ncbi:MAG: large-conductance mechanosensitive channel protein MscL [Clostridium sp.]|uniref:large-conductance mechanosensitive channel protein MscL n=1 Tax=Clostridium sp. TaxID=1506 RepID=UPI001EB869C1|nr:large-conductance mechanosensitive channel protein MscL [Clostridium sp.]MBS5886183.1 large-conductance mechanosensitive channel protein MscL [Clostridium sp.]MDU7149869.1 large-conductance mechanosensitive channel protein MscL [Clostridium sp.]MDU7242980.1 large-conductance mechanosensitive channel protein MscL [Clostridium sp.]
MKEKGKKFISEFKDFAMKGNVLDLAIGVIIGGAFNKIVSSLVKDIIMPPIGLITGGVNFSELAYVLKPGEGGNDPVTLNYGLFIQNIVDFLIIALSIFIFIKIVKKLNSKSEEEAKKEEEEEEKKLTVEQELLTEIRDLLKNEKRASKE